MPNIAIVPGADAGTVGTATGGLLKDPPMLFQPDLDGTQLFPFQYLWRMPLSVPQPKMLDRLEPQERNIIATEISLEVMVKKFARKQL
jgi:hypothetical protein